ncbi:DUF5681 domain-containing protein [Methylocystis sp. SB2]|uniref:DUF5681 domain-containing protein n=2 Tax=Methylocystis sp. (strain SB2) TaxID=743836 RepID=UPI001EFB932D|nr:DUF5681 domain-containing protein [Methylocystis sp. SB2]ULO23773.1 DUF5681 domain-containing protein [Methylocystis sp. SB2]
MHSRWPKGISGNPGGKKKRSVDLQQAFQAALERPIIVTIEGEKREISSLEAICMRLVDGGLKGDMRAITTILDRSTLLLVANGDDQKVETSEEDITILQRVLADREPKPFHKRQCKKPDLVEDECAQPRSDQEGEDD